MPPWIKTTGGLSPLFPAHADALNIDGSILYVLLLAF
jgi:hypothetical protein